MNIQQQFNDVFQPDVTQHPEYKLGQFHYQNEIPVKPSACVEYYLGYGNEYAQGECDSAMQSTFSRAVDTYAQGECDSARCSQ